MMPARMADDVCETYMVNTKLWWKDSVYGHTDAVVNLLKDLGVRIVRERLTTGTSTGTRNQQRAMLALAASGCRWHATIGNLTDWKNAGAVNRNAMSHLSSYYKPRVGGDLSRLIHSLGGCNEINGPVYYGHVDSNWAYHARIMQKALWAAAKNNAATSRLAVAGPSTRTDTTRTQAALLGDLSAICDTGNAHMYNRGTSPTRYIDDHIALLRTCFPKVRNWVFTETGYNDSEQSNLGVTIPTEAVASYVVRGIGDFFNRRSVYGRFELLDDPDVIDSSTQSRINQTTEREAHFGLIAMTKNTVKAPSPDTWVKKPEFYAVQRFLALLSDRGPSFSPSGLSLAITGGGSGLQKSLVQKRNGKHYLLLWRDVELAKPYPDGRLIKVAPVDVTVKMGAARPIAVFRPRTGSAPIATYSSRTTFKVPLAGELLAIKLG